MLFIKPGYLGSIREGRAGAWRWYAHSAVTQTVGTYTFGVGKLIAQSAPGGFATVVDAVSSMRAAMRGWKMMNIEYRRHPKPKEKVDGD